MIAKPSEKPAVDVEALAAALRALGMLYGASQPLAQTIAGAKDEAEAIRMYVDPSDLARRDVSSALRRQARSIDRNQETRNSRAAPVEIPGPCA